MKKKKYLAIFMAMSMATATAPVTALADDATTGTGAESGTETGESGSGETGSTGETGSENGGTEGGSTTAPDTPAENEGVKTIDELNAAITAAGETETTIKLAADITGDVVVPEKANITIDLNGKKITNSVGHTIMNNGTLTIKGEGTVDNITHGKAALYNKGTVTLNGGTFDRTQENGQSDSSSGGNSYYTIKNVGNMTINEGVNVLTAEGNGELGRFSSLVANGYYNGTTYDNDKGVDNPTLIINNGTFSGGLNTIKNDDRAELTINNGTFKNFYQATVQNHNIATINGGTYKAASDASSTEKEIYGVYNCGCGDNIDLGTLTVTGGIFEGADYAIADVSSQSAIVNIFGGCFSGAKGAIVKGTNSNATISISGGTLSDKPANAYVAEGYKAIQVKGDKYVVTNKIALDKTSTRIRRGYTDTLKAIVEANGKTYEVADPITWASDKEAVATVENGVVTGVDYGSATITATLGGVTEAPTTPGETETPDTTDAPTTQAEGDTATGDGTDTDGDNTPSNTLTASCTVTVFKKSSSSSSSGGGGSSVAKYGVTISDSKNGAVTASAAKAETGDKVILTPKADEGYVLDKITAKDKDGKEVKLKAEKDGTYSFTMPKGGVTVDTTFKQAEGTASTDKPAAATKTIILQIGSTAVIVDDQAIINDVAPVIRNDRTLVPIRIITEALGGQVAWNEAAKEVTLTVNGKEIKMTIGKALEKYGVAPVIIGGRTFVPVRFVADELGAVTTWDDATKTVTIQAVK
ncbi:MAG: stalk domain-containing protein [Anaerotignum faecicola]